MLKFALLAVTLGGLSACAFGNTYDYRSAVPKVDVKSDYSAVVAVVDRRRYIVDGDKAPNFVGLQRAGFGNPFNVKTTSGQPLAADFQSIMVASLRSAGMKAQSSNIPFNSTADDAIDKLKKDNSGRSVLLIIREWKTDTYTAAALHYDLRLEVYDKGQLLAKNRVHGTDSLGYSALPSQVGAKAAQGAKNRLQQLLNNPEVLEALRSKVAEIVVE